MSHRSLFSAIASVVGRGRVSGPSEDNDRQRLPMATMEEDSGEGVAPHNSRRRNSFLRRLESLKAGRMRLPRKVNLLGARTPEVRGSLSPLPRPPDAEGADEGGLGVQAVESPQVVVRLEGAKGLRRWHSLTRWRSGQGWRRHHPEGCVLLLYSRSEKAPKRASSFAGRPDRVGVKGSFRVEVKCFFLSLVAELPKQNFISGLVAAWTQL